MVNVKVESQMMVAIIEHHGKTGKNWIAIAWFITIRRIWNSNRLPSKNLQRTCYYIEKELLELKGDTQHEY